MTFQKLFIAVAAMAAVSGTALAQPAGGHMSAGHGASAASGPSKLMQDQMMKGSEKMHAMPLTGNLDRDFAVMMKAHHIQAVEMAKVQVAQGTSPEMKRMAEQIIKDQQKEIAMFDSWLAKQK